MRSTVMRFRKRAIAAAATMALGVGLFAGLGPMSGGASSHREAPLISGDPQVDGTDLWAFVSPDRPDTVTLVSSWLPLQEPAGGPNFFPWAPGARYDIKIDNNGDAKADITYRWIFTDHRRDGGNSFLYANGPVTSLDDENLLFYQTYDLLRIVAGKSPKTVVDDAITVPSNVGGATMPDFPALSDEGVVAYGGAPSYTWAGQSDDPFFLDLRVFDLLYGGNLSEVGDDTLAGFNVNTMALQVPKDDLAADGDAAANPIVGVWTTAARKAGGKFVQVSRLGMPLVNEVVIPYKDKDKFNASLPKNDGQFLSYVTEPELPQLIELVYGIPAPATPRDDLVAVFLTGVAGLNQPAGVTPSEQLRLNMSINPDNEGCAAFSRLGVIGGDICGFPNGRRLEDDVIDIALQVVEGFLLGQETGLGDGVDANDVPLLGSFPYVGYSHSGSDADPH
ncbi:MAG: DUF4331 domain-containing protein [Actinomycetota bacterium]